MGGLLLLWSLRLLLEGSPCEEAFSSTSAPALADCWKACHFAPPSLDACLTTAQLRLLYLKLLQSILQALHSTMPLPSP